MFLLLPVAPVLQLFRLGPGQYFAERHLLADAPYAASMVAKGPVRVLRLSRQWFEKVRFCHTFFWGLLLTMQKIWSS